MYRIGIKQWEWKAITNGEEAFVATEDVRYYSKPPDLSQKYPRLPIDYKEENRVKKLPNPQTDFDAFCKANGLEVRGSATSVEKLKKMALPAVMGGTLGAVVSGPIGAAVGAAVFGWFSSGSDFNPDKLSSVFLRTKEHALEWENYDGEYAIYQKDQQTQYIDKAKDNWRRYYKLKNLSGLNEMSGLEFEVAIAGLYEHKGYEVKITKASGDFGVDIIAKKGRDILAIQAKRYSGKVGVKAVQEVSAGAIYYKATEAIVITNSFYTEQAKELAKTTDITLINKKRLANMWESYHPDSEIPAFDLKKYEKLEKQIKKGLYRIDAASGRKFDKRYMR